jgi:hypothetical protein
MFWAVMETSPPCPCVVIGVPLDVVPDTKLPVPKLIEPFKAKLLVADNSNWPASAGKRGGALALACAAALKNAFAKLSVYCDSVRTVVSDATSTVDVRLDWMLVPATPKRAATS